jgi:hypothetical protein
MKKITAILLVACVAMLFTACKKEGVYNPSKKISRIYYTPSNGIKSLDEAWTWNKNNTLEKIDFYMSNSIYRTYNFSYDHKRLVKLSDYNNNRYVEYKYDGNKLKEANYYRSNALRCIYTFTYKDGKISIIEEKWLDSKSAEDKDNIMALDFIMPREFNETVANYAEKKENSSSKGTEIITYTLTWEKGNITKAKITEVEEDEYDEYTWEAKYDNKKNPYMGYTGFVDDGFESEYRSKNNITESTERWNNGSDYYTVRYDYSYEGQYPVSYRRSFDEGGYSGYSGMIEFEYTK